MKVLSVQQPWASLIVAGIKDVENRTWQPKQMPGRILIHASKKSSLRMMNKEPLEWVQEILNEQIFGNLPDFPDMPDGAIIGYVTVERVDHDNARSIWAAGETGNPDLYYWHLTDAHVFDEPITGVKGKLHLWEYDLDENNLPSAHRVELHYPVISEDSNVRVPLKKSEFAKLHANQSLAVEIGMLGDELCQPDSYDLKPMETITLFHDNEQRKFRLLPETEARYFTDGGEDQNPELYPSMFNTDGGVRWIAYFNWGEELK